MNISVDEETKIEDITENLYKRIQKETKKLLRQQLKLLGITNNIRDIVKSDDWSKRIYPDDPKALASYFYKGCLILGVRIGDNNMGIEFDTPEINTINKEGDSVGKSEEV